MALEGVIGAFGLGGRRGGAVSRHEGAYMEGLAERCHSSMAAVTDERRCSASCASVHWPFS